MKEIVARERFILILFVETLADRTDAVIAAQDAISTRFPVTRWRDEARF
jgi:hypothetical protein